MAAGSGGCCLVCKAAEDQIFCAETAYLPLIVPWAR